MKQWVRIKHEGAQVIIFDLETIKSFSIMSYDDGTYILIAGDMETGIILIEGTFDECHSVLNKLNKIQQVNIIDL